MTGALVLAALRCTVCGFDWRRNDGRGWNGPCPKCGSLYVDWVNHVDWMREKKTKAPTR